MHGYSVQEECIYVTLRNHIRTRASAHRPNAGRRTITIGYASKSSQAREARLQQMRDVQQSTLATDLPEEREARIITSVNTIGSTA